MTKKNLLRSSPANARHTTKPDDGGNAREQKALLNTAELAWITDTSRSTWEKKRWRGEGPPYIKVRNLVRYRWADVEAWLVSHEVSNREGQ